MNTKFKQLIKIFQKLPGVGPRQAARFILALMERSDVELKEMGLAIQNLKKEIQTCLICFNVSDNHKCTICLDPKRDQGKIMVMEKVTDLDSVEKTGLYRGLYHVLGGAISPLDNITPETIHIKELESRVNKHLKSNELELIIATNPNTAGETTLLYIKELFKNKSGVTLTRLARGLASGLNLEYVDEMTLRNALEYRK